MIFLVSAFQSYNILEIKRSVVTAIIELQLALRDQLAFTKKKIQERFLHVLTFAVRAFSLILCISALAKL